MCSRGWTGKTCQQDIDECVTNPCQHGRCVNKDGGYNCNCDTGWTGQNCRQDINECTRPSAPCQHGVCLNKDGGYKCICDSGWTGKNCQQDIDECVKSPCKYGECLNKAGGYTCSCDNGWTGINCQQGPCPVHWTYYYGFCYKFFGGSKTWFAAREECLSHGADLISITSADENQFLAFQTERQGLTKYRPIIWIGLKNNNGQWMWSDGSSNTYKNWASGEPNNMGYLSFSRAECAGMYYMTMKNWAFGPTNYRGQWTDQVCTEKCATFCKKKA
ncbi:uncharacterized protein LOC144919026 [Branchiostoma floridae x Branchiostoma belcheri]